MLVSLLNTPHNNIDWEYFSFANRDQINLIRQAIKTQKGINLPEYVLHPLDINNPGYWLENKSQAHQDFNSVLGLQSSDIKDVDIKDEKQLQSWVNIQYQELYSASAVLGI